MKKKRRRRWLPYYPLMLLSFFRICGAQISQESLIKSISVPFNTPFTVSINHKLRELYQVPLLIDCSNGYSDSFPAPGRSHTEIALNEDVEAGDVCVLSTASTDSFFSSNPVTVYVTVANVVLHLSEGDAVERVVAGKGSVPYYLDSTASLSRFQLLLSCFADQKFVVGRQLVPFPELERSFSVPAGAFGNCTLTVDVPNLSKNFRFPSPKSIVVYSPITFTTPQNSVVDARGFEVAWITGNGLRPRVRIESDCSQSRVVENDSNSLSVKPFTFGNCRFDLIALDSFYDYSQAQLNVVINRRLEIVYPRYGQLINSMNLLEVLVVAELAGSDDAISVFLKCTSDAQFVIEAQVGTAVSVQVPEDVADGECSLFATSQVPFYTQSATQMFLLNSKTIKVKLKKPEVVVQGQAFVLLASTDKEDLRVSLSLVISCSKDEIDEITIVTNVPSSLVQDDRTCMYSTRAIPNDLIQASNEIRIVALPPSVIGAFEIENPRDGSDLVADSTLAIRLTRHPLSRGKLAPAQLTIGIQLQCGSQIIATATGPSNVPLSLAIPAHSSGPCVIQQLPLQGYTIADPVTIYIYRKLRVQVESRVIVGQESPVLVSVSGSSIDTAIVSITCRGSSSKTFESTPVVINQPALITLPASLGDDTCTAVASTPAPFYLASDPSPPFLTLIPTTLKVLSPAWMSGSAVDIQVDALNAAILSATFSIACPTSSYQQPITLGTRVTLTVPGILNGLNCRLSIFDLPPLFIPFEPQQVNIQMSPETVKKVIKSMNFGKFAADIGAGLGGAVGGGIGAAAGAATGGMGGITAQGHIGTRGNTNAIENAKNDGKIIENTNRNQIQAQQLNTTSSISDHHSRKRQHRSKIRRNNLK